MARFGLVGPSYQSQSLNADAQVCQNWYVEHDESGGGKSDFQLYPTPGLILFCALPEKPVRAEAELNGRMFAVGGTKFCEVFANGTYSILGTVDTDSLPASIAVGPTFLSIASGGSLYFYNLQTATFGQVDTVLGTALQGPVLQVGFADGFFIALIKNSQKFQISALEDASIWDPLDIAQVSVFPDNILGMIVDHRELWLYGETKTIPYSDTGNPFFPFEPQPGAIIEQGTIAGFSCVRLDNTTFWLGGDERGSGIAWRAAGYLPARVSNHAVELAWQGYSRIDDVIGYAYQDQGHAFWVLYFPTANKTWVYGVATGMWHERSSRVNQLPGAHLSRCHVFCFGKHLVGDWASANIYQMAIPRPNNLGGWSFVDDNGTPIQRIRRAPHIGSEQEWTFHSQLQVDAETGLGPQPPLTDSNGNPRDPEMGLRWSDDGGHTWSNQHTVGCGQAGGYKTRAIWRRLGRSRDRVYEIEVSDPIPWRIVDAYLRASPGFAPTERLATLYRKSA